MAANETGGSKVDIANGSEGSQAKERHAPECYQGEGGGRQTGWEGKREVTWKVVEERGLFFIANFSLETKIQEEYEMGSVAVSQCRLVVGVNV